MNVNCCSFKLCHFAAAGVRAKHPLYFIQVITTLFHSNHHNSISFTRECLAAIPDSSISGKRATRELTMFIERRGKPRMIVSDNGTEFTSNAVLHWSKEHRVEWYHIAPGKPMQNGYIESFNAGCATSYSMKACFSISIRLGKSSPLGLPTTTPGGHILRWATGCRQPMPMISTQPTIALRYMRAPRAGQLLTPR